jgi:hypothetical protein
MSLTPAEVGLTCGELELARLQLLHARERVLGGLTAS